VFDALPTSDRGYAARRDLGEKRSDDRGFADPWFAGDEDDLALAA
jgi:hypothetical protein